jgi:uncharacterized protein (DUF302 family)
MFYAKEAKGTVEETLKKLQKSSADNQLGVMTVHNLREKMAEKGVEFGPECLIVEVCNPKQAKKVLENNMTISTALPCRISIYRQNDIVKVATIRPTALLKLFGNPELESTARDVEAAIIRAIDSACAG